MAPSEKKTRENRLRRMAARQGLRLAKSRSRDPLAPDYGYYWLFTLDTSTRQTKKDGISLDRVENYLKRDESDLRAYDAWDLNLAQRQNMDRRERTERREARERAVIVKAEGLRKYEERQALLERQLRAKGITID